jgi:hypothetical protein
MARLDELKWAFELAKQSLVEAEPDKRSPLLGQYRALLEEIEALEGADASESKAEVNGLVILQEEVAKRRQSGASGSRSASRRNV